MYRPVVPLRVMEAQDGKQTQGHLRAQVFVANYAAAACACRSSTKS